MMLNLGMSAIAEPTNLFLTTVTLTAAEVAASRANEEAARVAESIATAVRVAREKAAWEQTAEGRDAIRRRNAKQEAARIHNLNYPVSGPGSSCEDCSTLTEAQYESLNAVNNCCAGTHPADPAGYILGMKPATLAMVAAGVGVVAYLVWGRKS